MKVSDKRNTLYNYCSDTPCGRCNLVGKAWRHIFRNGTGDACLCLENADEDELDLACALIDVDEEDVVNRPKHYTDGKIEVIDYIEDKRLGFSLGNAIKYISRAGKKDPEKEIEDLKKAKWYIERRIKELEEATND